MTGGASVVVPRAYCELRGTREWPQVPITIYHCDDLSDRQVGYRVTPDGRSLIGPDGWRSEWTVIGHDALGGDPLFIDVTASGFPVYTATHGEGAWEPIPIARSAAVLFRSLDIAAAVREGRLNRKAARTSLEALNGDVEVDVEFWTVLME